MSCICHVLGARSISGFPDDEVLNIPTALSSLLRKKAPTPVDVVALPSSA
jgi:hypothetical protein